MKSQHSGQFKIAFLGGAINSAVGLAHYSAIRLVNEYEIVAGCFSRHAELNVESGQQYSIAPDRVYSSLTELLLKEKGKISAIVILTPTDQHPEQVLECIEAGIPVICEKALACSSQEAESIRNVLTLHQGFLSVIYNYLGYPMLRELKSIIESGKFGKPVHVQIEMPQEGFKRITAEGKPVIPQEWRLHDGLIPKISLDLGVHLHMLIKFLTGESPLAVVSTSQSLGNFADVRDNVSGIIQYSNDLVCNMWFSKIAIGNRNGLGLRIYCESGSAEWVQENPEYLRLADNRGKRWTIDRGASEANVSNQPRYTRFKAGHPAGFIEAFANYYTDIAEALEVYKQNKTTQLNSNCFGVDEALEGLNLLEAMAKSSYSKSWETVK